MKTSSKILIGLGAGLLTAATVYLFKKYYTSAKEEIRKDEEEENKHMEDLGIAPEILKTGGLNLDSEDIIKSLHQVIRHSPNWDLDVIDPDKVLGVDTIVHLAETMNPRTQREQLDFIFELPQTLNQSGYKMPKVAAFKKAVDEVAEEMWSKYVVTSNSPFKRLEAYVAIEYVSDGVDEVLIKRIPPEWYESYRQENNDGVVKFFEDYNKEDKCDAIKEKLLNNFIKTFVLSNEENNILTENLTVVDVFLGWRVSFDIQKNRKGRGINIFSAEKCLDYIVNNMEVKREGGETVKYQRIMFHGRDPRYELPASFYNLNGKLDKIVY